MQLLWVYYSIPILTGVAFSPFMSAAIALTLNLSAFVSEVYRAGIASIGRGQREAALALGMSNWQAMRRVILPQSIRRVLPPLGSIWVSLFKDTALVSVIAVPELMYRGKVLSIETYRPLEVYTAVAHHLFRRDLSPGARRRLALRASPGPRVSEPSSAARRPDDVLIEVRGLSKSFGDLQVLRDIDLDVHRGEVVCIIGPAGRGRARCCAVSTGWKTRRRARSASAAHEITRRGSQSLAGCGAGSAWSSSTSTSSRI